ncbi:hypothetical protein like AT1G76980 [Hibiscus trionum]|uniref:Uncharacterized protein n=1 Tax=Hibiscus trionum TaxID=183268 RepID=A0A9W7HIS3_HIBTR|nr:hypothetical protein like AT1G76980 [Hibiscus trionum]
MAPHPHFKQSAITPLPLTQFSYQNNMFDPSRELPKSFVCLSDQLRLSGSYDGYDDHAMNYASYGRWNTMVDDESGISSPPLWKTSPRREENIDYRCLTPSSRAQAIARGQRELMEMVSKMPESCYELTLKDLVEYQQPVVDEPKQESFAKGRGSNSVDELNNYKKERQSSQKQQQQINRSGSLNNGGFLLKMVFPVSLGSKKKNIKNTSNKSKVSPKPTAVADASAKTLDKDWWKKRSESSESDGGGSTINSGSTKSSRSSSINSTGSGRSNSCRSTGSTSGRRHRRKGCLAFIFSRKTKASR